MHVGSTQGVAAQGLGGTQRWNLVTEGFLQGFQLGYVASRGAGTVGVDVADFAIDVGHGLFHAANGAFTARCNHVGAVRGSTEADQFGQDGGTAGFRVFQGFQYQRAATTGDHEAVTVCIIGTRSPFRCVVVLGGQCAHGVKHQAQSPVDVFVTAGQHHILAAQGDLVSRVADTVGTGRAGRGNAVVDAGNTERRGDGRVDVAAHGAGIPVRAYPATAFVTMGVVCVTKVH